MASKLFFVFFFLIHLMDVHSTEHEFRLRKDLFTNQSRDPMIRPVALPSDVMNVSFRIRLNALVEVRNKEQLIATDVLVEQVWKNPTLTWDKSKYGGLDRIYVKPSTVWVPDTVLYNNGNERVLMAGHLALFKTFVILYSNGTNRWTAPASYVSSCAIDVEKFPFDRQTCQLEFGSWTMDIKDFDIFPLDKPYKKHAGQVRDSTDLKISLDRESIGTNGDWEIELFNVTKKLVRQKCCSVPYAVIVYTLRIRRRPVFHGLFLLLPCMIIGALILATFFLPPENGERIGLCSTILLAVSVYLLIVSELLPEKSDTLPLIGLYFIITMIEISLVLVATIFVLKAYHATSRPPRCLEIFTLSCKKRKKKTKVLSELQVDGTSATEERNDMTLNQTDEVNKGIRSRRATDISVIAQSMVEEKEENDRRQTWRQISVALDRLFFWIFTLLLVFSSIAVYSLAA